MKVEDAGAVVTLENRTAWLVAPPDRIKTMLWLPVTNISACDGSLLNTDANETAQARQVH